MMERTIYTELLSKSTTIPVIQPGFEEPVLRYLLEFGSEEEIRAELQALAGKLLNENRVEDAWQVWLRCQN